MKINGSLKFIPFIDPSNLLSSVKSGLYTFMEIVESNNPTSKIVIFDILPYRSSYSLWVLIAFGGFFFLKNIWIESLKWGICVKGEGLVAGLT